MSTQSLREVCERVAAHVVLVMKCVVLYSELYGVPLLAHREKNFVDFASFKIPGVTVGVGVI